jgi:flagellar L-ring protein precursor FlgH
MGRFIFILLLLLLALALPYSLKAQDQIHIGAPSLFTDIKAHHVGDLITILIYEDASAQNVSKTETKKEATFETSGGPGIGPLDFIPLFGVSGDANSEFKGDGKTLRSNRLKARMTARVTGLTANGDLLIEGTRVVGVNDDKEAITLSGIVRPADVAADNSVASYLIADAKIVYTGKGAAGTGSRPGLIVRLLNWIF